MEKAAVIYNPAAGQGKLEQLMDEILEKLHEAFDEVSTYRTEEPGDGTRCVQQIASEVDAVIAAGGDGTVHEIAGALCDLEKRPAFGVIPGGTCNDFSRAIGINQNPLRAAEQLAQKQTRSIEVGFADNQYFLNFWGIGLITQVSDRINPDTKDSFGRLAYYISAAQNLADPSPFKIKLNAEGYHYDGDAVMVLVGNGPFTGGVRAFFPRIDMADGKLDVLVIKEASLGIIWSILRSKMNTSLPFEDQDIVYFRTDKLEINAEPDQQIDCDGERSGQTPTVISALPHHLNVLIGNN